MMTAGMTHIVAQEFNEWLESAKPGERLTYAVGELAKSIHYGILNKEPDATKLSALQETAYRARDKAFLFQRRLGTHSFEYLAVKRSNGVSG
jgi:hypothetical protein